MGMYANCQMTRNDSNSWELIMMNQSHYWWNRHVKEIVKAATNW